MTRFEIMKSFKKKANEQSYSSIMRDLRKNDPDNVLPFMKSFKSAFDNALNDGLDDPDKLALMEAIKKVNYGS